MALNWDDLRIFLAVARDGNLSAAARTLKVTQPTVGRRLRSLEQRLAARLFDRLPEGFVPTAAGAQLLPLAEEMERSAEALERRQASLADAVSGTVRLSVMEAMARFLAEFVRDLRDRLPEIEIELAFTHLGANLSKREADLLIRECMPDNPGLIARKLGDLAYAVYGETGLVDRNPAARGETRYRDCPWVGYDEEHSHFADQQWVLARLAGRVPAIRVNNGLVLHEAVRRGAGLGVLPCFAGDPDPALVRLTPPVAELVSTQYLIVHRDLRRTPGVRAVMDELVVLFQRETPRLVGQAQRVAKSA
jgi:DNA-binding transcriptional LysR family regulator